MTFGRNLYVSVFRSRRGLRVFFNLWSVRLVFEVALLWRGGWLLDLETRPADGVLAQTCAATPLLFVSASVQSYAPERARAAWRRVYGFAGREVRFAFHDGGLWWRLWLDPHVWESVTPRWRDGVLRFWTYPVRDKATV